MRVFSDSRIYSAFSRKQSLWRETFEQLRPEFSKICVLEVNPMKKWKLQQFWHYFHFKKSWKMWGFLYPELNNFEEKYLEKKQASYIPPRIIIGAIRYFDVSAKIEIVQASMDGDSLFLRWKAPMLGHQSDDDDQEYEILRVFKGQPSFTFTKQTSFIFKGLKQIFFKTLLLLAVLKSNMRWMHQN